jgi:hypothetical protein
MCGIAMCELGWTDCDGNPKNGCEANLPNDPFNCGQCGTVCPSGQPCITGSCEISCGPNKDHAQCPGDPPNSCATLLGTNKNCNFCEDVCALANADSQCTPMNNGWVCKLVQCNTGYTDCDMNPANGCETNTFNDPKNCGSCGIVCGANENCGGGFCSCIPGFADCNMMQADGCETDLSTDAMSCGSCGNACAAGHACVAGMCQ